MASAVAIIAATIGSIAATSASAATVRGPDQRYLVTAATVPAYDAALAQANRDGLRISLQMREIKTFVVTGRIDRTVGLARMADVRIGLDHIETVALADGTLGRPGGLVRHVVDLAGADGGHFGIRRSATRACSGTTSGSAPRTNGRRRPATRRSWWAFRTRASTSRTRT
jgi:hypothetical protein